MNRKKPILYCVNVHTEKKNAKFNIAYCRLGAISYGPQNMNELGEADIQFNISLLCVLDLL